MDRQKTYRFLLMISLLVIVSLACALTSTIDRIREGQQAVETIQGIATEFDESGIISTGEALATEIDESGLQETALAVATDIGESGIPETAQAFATDIVIDPGDVPADIPIFEGEKEAFVGSDQVISYFVKAEFQDVLNYYQSEMPARGWTAVDTGTVVTDSTANLIFKKDGREVTIVIGEVPFVGQVTVVISLP